MADAHSSGNFTVMNRICHTMGLEGYAHYGEYPVPTWEP